MFILLNKYGFERRLFINHKENIVISRFKFKYIIMLYYNSRIKYINPIVIKLLQKLWDVVVIVLVCWFIQNIDIKVLISKQNNSELPILVQLN